MVRPTWIASALIACAAMLLSPIGAHAQAQQMAVPAYFYPGPLWTQMEQAAPTVGIAVVNPDSGPGAAKDPSYVSQVAAAQAAGIIVLGYVHTSYGARPFVQVQREIRQYFAWYHVSGILFDEAANTANKLAYYKRCYDYAKSMAPNVTVAINPGDPTLRSYMSVCDIVCTFESDYSAYEQGYTAPGWVNDYPANRFWQIVLNVPTEADMQHVVEQSKRRHAGYLFVTPLTVPNPYDNLPQNPYWTAEISALATPTS